MHPSPAHAVTKHRAAFLPAIFCQLDCCPAGY